MAGSIDLRFTLDGAKAPADFQVDFKAFNSTDNSFVADQKGILAKIYDNIAAGSYYLQTTKVPAGVDPAVPNTQIIVVADGQTTVVTVDYKSLSNTTTYLGIGVAALAAYFMFFRKKSAPVSVGG